MNLFDLIRRDGVRITYEDKWLIQDAESLLITVYQRKHHAKITQRLYEDYHLSKAIEILLTT